MRRIGTGVHVGIRDGAAVVEPALGPVQGSVLSPLLGNVYGHSVRDRWCDTEVQPRLRGKAPLLRSCDDVMIGFAREEEARRVRAGRETRLGRFRTDPAPGQDTAGARVASVNDATERSRSGHL